MELNLSKIVRGELFLHHTRVGEEGEKVSSEAPEQGRKGSQLNERGVSQDEIDFPETRLHYAIHHTSLHADRLPIKQDHYQQSYRNPCFFKTTPASVRSCHADDSLRKLFKTPIFERWGKQFCLN
jgi:hypothetical protein